MILQFNGKHFRSNVSNREILELQWMDFMLDSEMNTSHWKTVGKYDFTDSIFLSYGDKE